MKEMIKNYWLEFKNGIKTMFKEFFNKNTNKKQRANMWTFTRLITSFFIPICSLISILTSSLPLFIGSIAITGFGALTDFFDGRCARKYNSFSEFGKKLDQIADKVFSFMIGLTLSLFNPLFLVNVIGEMLIAGTNAAYKLKYNDLNIKSTQIGRIKQWPLFISLILGFISTISPNLSSITNEAIILTSLFQITTIASYINNNNKLIKKMYQKKNIDNNLINLEDNNDKEKNSTKNFENKINLTNQNDNKIKNEPLSFKDELIIIREYLKNESTINIVENKDKNSYQKTRTKSK